VLHYAASVPPRTAATATATPGLFKGSWEITLVAHTSQKQLTNSARSMPTVSRYVKVCDTYKTLADRRVGHNFLAVSEVPCFIILFQEIYFYSENRKCHLVDATRIEIPK
jgi:hypothetical protein